MTTTRRTVMLGIDAETPKDAAAILRDLADRIEQGATFDEALHERTAVAVREGNDNACGEMAFSGRYFAVGYDSEDMRPPVALFADEGDAYAYANGASWTEDEKPSSDGVVVRADVVALEWNSYDPDPAAAAFPRLEFL